jgi:Icc-related predicted phosphoesterase
VEKPNEFKGLPLKSQQDQGLRKGQQVVNIVILDHSPPLSSLVDSASSYTKTYTI